MKYLLLCLLLLAGCARPGPGAKKTEDVTYKTIEIEGHKYLMQYIEIDGGVYRWQIVAGPIPQ